MSPVEFMREFRELVTRYLYVHDMLAKEESAFDLDACPCAICRDARVMLQAEEGL